MIVGIHALIYSRVPERTRVLLQKILKTRTVDAGGGWPIMALPPGRSLFTRRMGLRRTSFGSCATTCRKRSPS